LAFCLVLSACRHEIPLPPPEAPGPPADQLLSRADKLCAQKRPELARPLYQDFLARNSKAREVPAVLMKLAAIDSSAGRHALAQNWHRELLARFPGSVYAPDARVGLLQSYLDAGSPRALLREAPGLLATAGSDTERSRILALEGRAALEAEAPAQAFGYYGQAAAMAPESAQAELAGSMARAAALFSDADLAVAGHESSGCISRTVATWESAGRLARAGRFKEAAARLQEVQDACPGSPLAPETEARLARVLQMASFRPDVLGCLLPLSGPYARFGESVLAGAELAVSLHNLAHPGRELSLLVEDSRARAADADRGLLALADQGAALVVGPMVTAESVGDLARELGIPAVVFTQKDLNLAEGGFLFRNYLTPRLQAEALVSYFTDVLSLSRFAVLYPEDDYGRTYMNAFWDAALERGGILTGVEPYPPGQTDVGDPIRRLVGLFYERPEEPGDSPTVWEELDAQARAARQQAALDRGLEPLDDPDQESEVSGKEGEEEPDAVVDFQALFIPDVPQQAGLILPQLPFNDVTGVLVAGTNLWHSPTLVDLAGRYGRGALCPDLFWAGSRDPLVAEFVARFQEAFGREPGVMEALGFDTVRMALAALSQEGVTSRKALRDALVNMGEFRGVTGRTSFSENGEARKTLFLLKATSKGFVEVR